MVRTLRRPSSRSDSDFATLRNKDINQYNEQAKEMAQLICEHQKMKIRVEGYEKAMADADADAGEDDDAAATKEAGV